MGYEQASTNMDVPVMLILAPIWTDGEVTTWTDMGWPRKWVRFTRKGSTRCEVTHYVSCSGVAQTACTA
jgi:hypothetical protein